MDKLVCLSQKFVNKQNVRSFSNLPSLLNFAKEDTATSDIQCLLRAMEENLKMRSKRDFMEYFEHIDKAVFLEPVDKHVIFQNCWRALADIVPINLYQDNNNNNKLFRQMVEATICSMRHQHFKIGKFLHKWDFKSPLWNSEGLKAKELLCEILLWIIHNILSPIITLNFYVTTCKINLDEYKLHFFWKHHWQSFHDKKISEMMFIGILKKFDPYCLGRKLKTKHSLSERLKIKSQIKDIPRLHLVLKKGNNYRPIVQYKNSSLCVNEKYKIKERLHFLKILIGKKPKRIDTAYSDIFLQWQNSDKPKLYFVKTDLSNAFGSVLKEKLLKILYERHTTLQKAERTMSLKRKYAQQFNDLITELRRPLLVRAGSTIYEWRQGLVQGYKYSPALSELYYSYMDDTYFTDHLKNSTAKIKLFIRVVDDYLYITDSLDDAQLFLTALANYRNVNYSKTEINFEHLDIKFSEDITFLGNSYNTNNLQVSRASTAFMGQMCYKIAFTGSIADVDTFLEKRISKSGIPITSHIFNFYYNPEDQIWKHIFTTFCLSANKFCTTLAVACDEPQMVDYLNLYKKKVSVKLSNSIVEMLLKNKPDDFKFNFCINHLHYLSWKSLYLCAKGTQKCSGLIPSINIQLSKTNCLYGKWQKHHSIINSNGEMLQAAKKYVCSRNDLRKIVKEFTTLPMGFKCYHHRHK